MGVLHDSTTPLCNPLDGNMEGDTLPTGTLPPTCMPTCRPFAVWLILIGDSFFFFFFGIHPFQDQRAATQHKGGLQVDGPVPTSQNYYYSCPPLFSAVFQSSKSQPNTRADKQKIPRTSSKCGRRYYPRNSTLAKLRTRCGECGGLPYDLLSPLGPSISEPPSLSAVPPQGVSRTATQRYVTPP